MNVLTYYYYYLSSVFAEFSPVIRIEVTVIMLLFFLSLTALLIFLRAHYLKTRERRHDQEFEKQYAQIFTHLLFFNKTQITKEELTEEYRIKKLKRNWQKRTITKLILSIKNNPLLQDEGGVFNHPNYVVLLQFLEIVKFWEKKMKSGNTVTVIKALRIANKLEVGITGSVIARSVYHRKNYLRKFARSTFTRYDLHNPYKFLESGFDKDFNKFDEVRIHHIFSDLFKRTSLPQLIRWLDNVDSVKYKCFIIKEIGYFKQKESAPYLLDLLTTSRNVAVKCKIAVTLGKLQYFPALKVLEKEFVFAPKHLQLCLVQAVSYFESKNIVDFIKKAYESTRYSDVKIKIVQTVHSKKDRDILLNTLHERHRSDFEDKIFAYALKYAG